MKPDFQKKFALQAVEFASGEVCPFAGQYLKFFDPETDDGLGFGMFCLSIKDAMEFDSVAAALDFWNQQSTVKPIREDGLPNRPLTCTTVQVVPMLLVPTGEEND